MTRMERPTATMACCLPRRRAMRRYRSPRNVSVLPAEIAASPTALARWELPWPVAFLPCFFPADSWTVRENLAHDASCAAVGNRVMSSPTSAMITLAVVTPTPGIGSRRATASAKGAICSSIRVSTSAMSASIASIRASILVSRNAWWSLNRPTNASSSWLILTRMRARASCARTFGSRSPAISAAIIARPETGEDVRCHDRQLDLGVLQQLLHPLLLRRPYAHQVDPVARQVPQHPDRWRGHETGTQHLPLGDLAQPDGIELVRLGPTWQVFDVLGVDQPGLEPGRLQQVERRFPVVAGCLHHHPGHPDLAQPVAHPQQRPRHRRIGRHFLQSLAGGLAVRNPDTTDQLRLADVERRDPLDDLFVVLRRFQHCRFLPTLDVARPGRPRRELQGDWRI